MNDALTAQASFTPDFFWLLFTRISKRPLLAATLVVAMVVGVFTGFSTGQVAVASESVVSSGLPEGTYLFGESPETAQVGRTYMVFTVKSEQVIGAFYQPASAFDCFRGQVASNEMALTITDSYAQTAYAYTLPLETNVRLASTGGPVTPAPLGFHALPELTDLDREVLATCQADQVF